MYTLVKVNYKTRRSNTYELRVRAMISELAHCKNLGDFKSQFQGRLDAMPKSNHAAPSYFYTTELKDRATPPVLEIWHLNAAGDKDRMVAEVVVEEVSEEKYKQLNPIDFW